MSKNLYDLCFGVLREDGYTSNLWRLWITKPGDLYLTTRGMGGIQKYSFHKSGICRSAFTQEHGTPAKMNDRATFKWVRAGTPPIGSGRVSRVAWIAIPTDFLSRDSEKYIKSITWIPAAPSGKATYLELIYTSESESTLHTAFQSSIRHMINYTSLPSGESFILSYYHDDWENKEIRSPAAKGGVFSDLIFSTNDPKNTGRPIRMHFGPIPKNGDEMILQELGGYPDDTKLADKLKNPDNIRQISNSVSTLSDINKYRESIECPKKLYKYVVPERIDILKNKLIRFTQPSALNDPFELVPMFEELVSEDHIINALNPSLEYIEPFLRQQYETLSLEKKAQMSLDLLIAFCRENPQLLKQILEDMEPSFRKALSNFAPDAKKILNENLQKVGILSLSETIDNPLLWAHYASSHKGFAIEFNTEHNFFNRRRFDNDELFHLRKVKYTERSSIGYTLLDLDGDDLLVTKEPSWAHEAEWRILALLESADKVLNIKDDEIHLFTIPSSAISGIILGARASDSLYEDLKTHLQSPDKHHITLKKALLDTTNQKIQVN